MNVEYRYIFRKHGWRWLIHIITSEPSGSYPTTVVQLPDNVLEMRLEWATSFDKIPVGLPKAPTLKLGFDMDALDTTPELRALHDKLIDPFVKTEPQTYTITPEPYTYYSEQWGELTSDSGTYTYTEDETDLPLLTNVVFLSCDFGEELLEDDELTSIGAFCQGLSNDPIEWDIEKGVLEIEFSHVWKYVLEQVSTKSLVKKLGGVSMIARDKLITYVMQKPSSTEKRWIQASVLDVETGTPIQLHSLQTIFDTAKEMASKVLERLYRTTGATMTHFDAGYLKHSFFFEQNPGTSGNLGIGAPITDALTLYTPYHIGSASESEQTFTEGGFADGGKLLEAETLFDFMYKQFEGGVIGQYHRNGLKAFRLGEGSGTLAFTLNRDNCSVKSLKFAARIVRAGEVNADDGANIRSTTTGQTKGQYDFAANVFFHNHAYKLDSLEQNDNKFVQHFNFLTGKLYYDAPTFDPKATNPIIAAHPAMELAISATQSVQLWSAPVEFPYFFREGITGQNGVTLYFFDDEKATLDLEQYALDANTQSGLARVLGEAVIRHFAEYKSCLLEIETHIQDAPLLNPLNVGAKLTIDWDGIASPRMATKLPQSAYLLASTLNAETELITAQILAVLPPT